MSSPAPPLIRLVEHLQGLAEREDRAALAALRSSFRQGHELDGLRVVLPVLGSSTSKQLEDDALLLGGLFALYPEPGSRTLAEGLRIAAESSGSDSIEGRFRALLGCGREELPTHLRHAVSLLASKQLAIDWNDLAYAIRFWGDEERRVQRRWARQFWGAVASGHDSESSFDND